MKKVNLRFKQGSSDKVYQAQLEEVDGGYVVNFQYGRYGSTLTAGTKTAAPVDLETAEKTFNKLVQEKMAKGYVEGEAGTPYVGGDMEDRVSGFHVQLLNPLHQDHLEEMLNSGGVLYAAQEKFDGKRMLLRYDGSEATAINRKGLTCGAPEPILLALTAISKGDELVIDGECIGDTFYAFDILVNGGKDVRDLPYIERARQLSSLILDKWIKVAPIALDSSEKWKLYDQLYSENKEGIVFKQTDAPYTPGRPASGGTQYKFKFQSDTTCVVTSVNTTKRSFSIGVDDHGTLRQVGNCTVPANKEIPQVGDLVEIRYLYFHEGGSLFQPFFKGPRDDKNAPDQYSTLKFKAETAQAAGEF